MSEQHRVVPMRLFANWEVDRAAPNSVPRVCMMTLTRLTLLKPIEHDVASVLLAVRLQSSKRTLRSNDLNIQGCAGMVDINLDISFTIQYPHYIKRKTNCLQIMLQRRKRYKNRPIPGGFKTLAVGIVNLTEVMQNSIDRELCLFTVDSNKDEGFLTVANIQNNASAAFAKLFFLACNSQPLEPQKEVSVRGRKSKEINEQQGEFTDDEADDDSTNDDVGSDSDQAADDAIVSARSSQQRNKGRSMNRQKFARQKNLKQKFVAMLRKFKISEEAFDASTSRSHSGVAPTTKELEALFEELENISPESGAELEMDKISIISNPRPGLRPYFASNSSSKDIAPTSTEIIGEELNISDESRESVEDGDAATITDPENMFGDRIAIKRSSLAVAGSVTPEMINIQNKTRRTPTSSSATPLTHSSTVGSLLSNHNRQRSGTAVEQVHQHKPRSVLVDASASTTTTSVLPHSPIDEQIAQVLRSSDDVHATGGGERIWLISAFDVHSLALVDGWRKSIVRVLIASTLADVRCVLTAIVARIQRFCHTSSSPPSATAVCIVGGDRFVSYVVRAYVETMAQKTSDWLNYLRFALLTPTTSIIGRSIPALETVNWQIAEIVGRDWWDRVDFNTNEINELTQRIAKCVNTCKSCISLSIGEAMLQLHDKRMSGIDNTQLFIPFLIDVRIGSNDDDNTESTIMGVTSAGSPRDDVAAQLIASQTSPPSSPHTLHGNVEAQELHIEYWANGGGVPESGASATASTSSCAPSSSGLIRKESSSSSAPVKCSIKTAFRALAICRMPDALPSSALCLQFVKEKKKEKMLQKFGMKNRQKAELDASSVHTVTNVSRLICSSKHSTMRIAIDGVDWTNVKFFQTSAQWQTHVKHFPLLIMHSGGDASAAGI